ncbi:MAG TPA: HAMP domain-containing sensor histidine kinase [Rariglobus sp.]|jgi:two-component system sensor histidine kinase CpxA|nr:HAMP domain-containing sensor histidine kinase [Rariglobus sp.]
MRAPLALKVSGWLLLNLSLLVVLAIGLLVAQGGFTWTALVEGPPGRRVQDMAEALAADMHNVSPEQRTTTLARFGEAHDVSAVLFGEGGRILGGDPSGVPSEVLKFIGPPPSRRLQGLPPDDGDPLDQPAPVENLSPRPESRPQRVLLHVGDPAVFWLAVRIKPPEPRRAGVTLVLRVPSLGHLLRLLDLAPWLWIGAGTVVISLLFWLPFVRGLTRDLGKLTRATEAIADGRFDTRVAEKRRDELGALGGSVNRMAGRLDRLVTGQKRFLGDIAHELGSPLGRMQVSVGILEQRAGPELQNAITDVREEVEHMSILVGELLVFTKAGLRPRDAVLGPVTLAPLAARVIAREAADDAVRVDLPVHLAVLADADLLARAIGNLVRNALRHAGRAAITLRTETSGDDVFIIVEDEGPGVPPDSLARLGEPLFRPESARSRETGGAGLGLAIVKSCVEACGGGVRFENREPHGFRAVLRLPAA